jgi:putative transposase
MQNAFVESFNGRMRDELLNETLFFGLVHAKQEIAAGVSDYNHQRPHSALGYETPVAYAVKLNSGEETAKLETTAPISVNHAVVLNRSG